MGKGIYTYYKERLIEIGGNSKCLYLKNISRRTAYDLGRILHGRDGKIAEFTEFLASNRKYPIAIISPKEKKDIVENLDIQGKIDKRRTEIPEGASPEEAEKINAKNDRIRRDEANKAIEAEIEKLKELKREIEEIEKETGRYELFLGYPFVFGAINGGGSKTVIKAPLMLFPIRIELADENTVELRFNDAEKIRINPALIYSYAQAKRINVDEMELEFDNLSSFKSISDIIEYLDKNHIKIDDTSSKNIFHYSSFKEPDNKGELSVRSAAVLARFPLSNSIYNDYTLLEKKKLTNDAINELLRTKKVKESKPKKAAKTEKKNTYTIKMLDYAQYKVVKKVSEKGNMVIYGPPGTGKSQTIVNIISDSLSNGKRVLVVSQKKAALDVVYNRLGLLNEKCMYITDESKEKRAFFERCFDAHQKAMEPGCPDTKVYETEYNELEEKIKKSEALLDSIYNTFNDVRPFGLSLSDMYSSSTIISKNSNDYNIYQKLLMQKDIMALDYKRLSEALDGIKGQELEKTYYDFLEDKKRNPLIDMMQPDMDIHTLTEVKGTLAEVQKTRKGLFNLARYPYYRHVMAYFKELSSEETLDEIIKLEVKMRYPDKLFTKKYCQAIKDQFVETMNEVDKFTEEYKILRRVLTEDGYIAVIDNILRGNTAYLKLVYEALDGYIAMRDITKVLDSLDNAKLQILNFAYTASKNYQNYVDIIDKLMELRIYHEIINYEESLQDKLAITVDYPNIRTSIARFKEMQLDASIRLTALRSTSVYKELFEADKEKMNYLYTISKKQKFWPIRKTMEHYSGLILTLFPCWLLSPDNVSSILPLIRNMFDVVIFDEASQVFIESTIPTIYRGKNIVVAGDAKQLRPSTTFMKRYLGADTENMDDVSMQAALEVDSLLDLAVARYESANLTYHYRSKSSELIDFSNHAFYNSALQISPNISKNLKNRPIERFKVNGKWVERRNVVEAKKVVELLYDIFKTRKNNESIGIITFNADQQTCIADLIEKECLKSPEFRSYMINESHRIENGEDTSIFIKNLENVQGDERDIIIFSIGYAQNEDGRVYTSFGSLSSEGGENRLNVAITRAKSKILLVTSIEPEDLKVEGAKNAGPKLLKKYLSYVRAVSQGDAANTATILSELNPAETKAESLITRIAAVEDRIKEKLTKLGYTVDTRLGNRNNRISLAIYDEKTDRYLVGVELDRDAFEASSSTMERDVYKPMFLEAKGWTIIRVFCRDWWLYPQKVIKAITDAAEANRKSAQ